MPKFSETFLKISKDMEIRQHLFKEQIKHALVEAMRQETDIHKIIIFGSFLESDTPNDIDVAVFGEFTQGYLDAALRPRKKVRHIAKILPVDIIPIREQEPPNSFVQDICNGEVIYEKPDTQRWLEYASKARATIRQGWASGIFGRRMNLIHPRPLDDIRLTGCPRSSGCPPFQMTVENISGHESRPPCDRAMSENSAPCPCAVD